MLAEIEGHFGTHSNKIIYLIYFIMLMTTVIFVFEVIPSFYSGIEKTKAFEQCVYSSLLENEDFLLVSSNLVEGEGGLILANRMLERLNCGKISWLYTRQRLRLHSMANDILTDRIAEDFACNIAKVCSRKDL